MVLILARDQPKPAREIFGVERVGKNMNEVAMDYPLESRLIWALDDDSDGLVNKSDFLSALGSNDLARKGPMKQSSSGQITKISSASFLILSYLLCEASDSDGYCVY